MKRHRPAPTAVAEEAERRAPRLGFDPTAPASVVEELRRELERGPVAAVTVDLSGAEYLDPAALRALAAAAELARSAGAALFCSGARPPVYKALHVAKLEIAMTPSAVPPGAATLGS